MKKYTLWYIQVKRGDERERASPPRVKKEFSREGTKDREAKSQEPSVLHTLFARWRQQLQEEKISKKGLSRWENVVCFSP